MPTDPVGAEVPVPTGAGIVERQDQPDMLDVLRAKSAAYDSAQGWYTAELVLTVVVPLVLALGNAVLQHVAQAVLVYDAVAGVLFLLVLDPRQKARRALGARFQEWFDCNVLGLPWRSDRLGPPPPPETIRQWARGHRGAAGLRHWYPAAVGVLPSPVAVLVCQRANGTWSANLRERYARMLWWTAAAIVIAIVIVAIIRSASLVEVLSWLGTVVVPVLALVNDAKAQADVARDARELAARAAELWRRVLDGVAAGAADGSVRPAELREMQNDICALRQRAPQLLPWVYHHFRGEDEREMRDIATTLVEHYIAAGRTGVQPSRA